MCVGCFVVSAFTLFMPPTDLPSAPTVAPWEGESLPQTQVMMFGSEQEELQALRQAMDGFMAALPQDEEGQLLRQKFGPIQQELHQTQDLAIANDLLDDGFNTVRDQILESPQADTLMETLYEIREAQWQKMQAARPFGLGVKQGWLG